MVQIPSRDCSREEILNCLRVCGEKMGGGGDMGWVGLVGDVLEAVKKFEGQSAKSDSE
jgi:hypothetical protein